MWIYFYFYDKPFMGLLPHISVRDIIYVILSHTSLNTRVPFKLVSNHLKNPSTQQHAKNIHNSNILVCSHPKPLTCTVDLQRLDNFSKNLGSCSSELHEAWRKWSLKEIMAWWWVNDERIFILGWSIAGVFFRHNMNQTQEWEQQYDIKTILK